MRKLFERTSIANCLFDYFSCRSNNPIGGEARCKPIDVAWRDLQRTSLISTYQSNFSCQWSDNLSFRMSQSGGGRIHPTID